jgi:cell division septal protein FtsQ
VRPGQNLLALRLEDVKRDLEMQAVIESVSVERVLPGTLRLRITERQPVAQISVPVLKPGGGFDLKTYQIDEHGYVMLPLDPRQRVAPSAQSDDQLPLILGIRGEVQPGRKLDSAQVQAALKWVDAFESSEMANLVELKTIDIVSPEVLIVTTGQGSSVTFGLNNFEQQLLRWKKIQEECARLNRAIATLNLAVTDNTPLRFNEPSVTPLSAPKTTKPQRIRRRNV